MPTTSTPIPTRTSSTTTRTTPVRTIALPDQKPGQQPARTKTSAAQRAAALKKKHERAERRQRQVIIGTVVVLVVVLAGVFTYISSGSSSKKTPPAAAGAITAPAGGIGPEGIPIETGVPLAGLGNAATGKTVNGVECGSKEQTVYHIHSHLAVYVDGVLRPIPMGIGIVGLQTQSTAQGQFAGATTCYYWLHTHAYDGILHVESPSTKLYPLSDVFAIWGQPLSSSAVGPASGTVTAYVNGKIFTGDPGTITLSSHETIQLDVGKVVAPVAVDWSKAQL